MRQLRHWYALVLLSAASVSQAFMHYLPAFVAPKSTTHHHIPSSFFAREKHQGIGARSLLRIRELRLKMTGRSLKLVNNKTSELIESNEVDALFPGASLSVKGEIDAIPPTVMRPPPDPKITSWDGIMRQLTANFSIDPQKLEDYSIEVEDKESLLRIYRSMQLSRQFENACNQQYMQGKIKGFMHLDNGQESIPALINKCLQKSDKKYSYYREHCHALASGVDPGKVMAELFMKDGGICRGAGGSMHIFVSCCILHLAIHFI